MSMLSQFPLQLSYHYHLPFVQFAICSVIFWFCELYLCSVSYCSNFTVNWRVKSLFVACLFSSLLPNSKQITTHTPRQTNRNPSHSLTVSWDQCKGNSLLEFHRWIRYFVTGLSISHICSVYSRSWLLQPALWMYITVVEHLTKFQDVLGKQYLHN